jgi:heme exporter protein CcmB
MSATNAMANTKSYVDAPAQSPERGFFVAFARDAKLAARSKGEIVQALAFFVVVVSLFPLAIGPESALLKRIAPGVVWVAALLSVLLTLPRVLANDYADGTLEQLALSVYPLPLIAAGNDGFATGNIVAGARFAIWP